MQGWQAEVQMRAWDLSAHDRLQGSRCVLLHYLFLIVFGLDVDARAPLSAA